MLWIKKPISVVFPDVSGAKTELEIEVESGEPVWVTAAAAYAHPDAMCREFERGLVLANPSPRPYTFDLAQLFPGKQFRRCKGTANQDPVANSGAAVPGPLTLGPKDALFLVKINP